MDGAASSDRFSLTPPRPLEGAAPRIGLLVGSRDSSGALVASDGLVLSRVSVPNTDTPDEGLDSLGGMVVTLRRKAERLDLAVAAIGVGFPGVIDPGDGTVRGTRLALRAWRGTSIAASLAERFGLPVTVHNDVVCSLLGEAAAGAARGETDVILAYSSAGVGGAIMLGGRVLLGRRGAAGHLGHTPSVAAQGLPCTCGGSGHLESVASAAGMTHWYRDQGRRNPGDVPYLRVVAQAAATGDAVAVAALRRGGAALGMALGGVANLLEPDVVVLAGESATNAIFRTAAVEALQREIIPGNTAPDVRRSELGGSSQVIGAALSA